MHAVMLAIGRGASRIFRNHVGVGWTGRVVSQVGNRVTLENARAATFGLCKGSSDLVGWSSIEIRPEHVGRRMAIFTAVEVKSQRGLPTVEQSQFIEAVKRAGGIGLIAHSPEEAQEHIETF